jgi:hypothetical protein
MGGFLPGFGLGNRDSLLGIIRGATGFLPGQSTPADEGYCDRPENRGKLECMFYGPTAPMGPVIFQPSPLPNAVTRVVQAAGTALARRARAVPQCTYTTAAGKQRAGKAQIVNGQVVCGPKPRRMSPCNPHAARRAVRRLNMVHNFMRSIEKSMTKTCRPMHARRSTGGKCGTCRKVKCSC